MTRKYRQRGYQDEDRRDEKPRGPRKGPKDPSAPRSPRMPGFLTVVRCGMCGATAPEIDNMDFDALCLKCGAALHACKNCVNFDPNVLFECTEPIEERVPKKDARNECTFFEARTRVEKEITTATAASSSSSPSSTSRATPADDPRAAFERLFKK